MTHQFPLWLHILAEISLELGLVSALIIIADETSRPQQMWIMNLVWPLCALFGGLIWLALYFRWKRGVPRNRGSAEAQPRMKPPPWVAVTTSASHCGAGCTLGDILAEWLAYFLPGLAIAFGWKSLFGEKIYAVWVVDFILAFGLGIGFQYYTIKPMRDLSPRDGLIEALKADTATILAWQIGMCGFMALAQFGWAMRVYGAPIATNRPEFWLMMQVAMLCGFVTSYPVNWLLLKMGIKEEM
ncbi:DUF4396 domain-containing protein [uncultured Methylovirgula sp.]|uniref:DUF4396 domain-containing protein n=1 Tax=uncultured Methylovirgula sp. TaxID=1285960 RepID=UPI002626F621|nr:DUF4396 domain-containing protein [uncultured Methylovirgula sp.]